MKFTGSPIIKGRKQYISITFCGSIFLFRLSKEILFTVVLIFNSFDFICMTDIVVSNLKGGGESEKKKKY